MSLASIKTPKSEPIKKNGGRAASKKKKGEGLLELCGVQATIRRVLYQGKVDATPLLKVLIV